MRQNAMTLQSTDLQILDEDFIALSTTSGDLAMTYDQMLDLIAQFSQAVEEMDLLANERVQCTECNQRFHS